MWGCFRDLISQRHVLLELARNDLRSRYVGSYLGIVWAFAQPAATILVLWVVLAFGFRAGEVQGYPFVLWLISGLVAWNFFAESLLTGTQSILEHSFLVKKMVFRSSILPAVKIVSSLVVHLIFLAVVVALLSVAGYPPTKYLLQLPLLIAATFGLVLGLSWLSASVLVFCRDLGQLVQLAVQMLFWLTPIIWTLTTVPPKYQVWFALNPLVAIVNGYRCALLGDGWIWDLGGPTVVMLVCTISVMLLGSWVFARLQPHFADVV